MDQRGVATGGVSIRLARLCKSFGSVNAVQSLTLTVQAGEFVTMLGPSGSGKTTTLMMIAGFETSSAGEIWLGDQLISRQPSYKRNLGVVFQNYALFPHLTVYDNLAFPLRMRHLARPEMNRLIAKALDLVKLSGYEHRLPHQLSGGQQQRVALARALVFRPGVVLMDEPLGALDKQLREHMQIEIGQLQRALGMTVLYVTHDQCEALTMSDRIVVMNHGRLEQAGSPEEVYERPATRFVARFLGESNFLEGNLLEARSPHEAIVAVEGLRIVTARSLPTAQGGGVRVTLMVRPEKVIVDSVVKPYENVFNGTVEEAIYSGDHAKYRIRFHCSPGTDIVATRPIRSELPRLAPGRTVRVAWSAADTQVVPHDVNSSNAEAHDPQIATADGKRSRGL